jgi:tRNA-Thr(GGU) m(6)t(6)A37 methyltransferase TsaA
MELKTIARIRSPFPEKFGIPFQSNVVENVRASVVFEPEYRNPDALRGLDAYSHLWLIWGFSETARDTWSPTVRPPRLGGNTRRGVFATRSPYRPNALGLSSVRIEGIDWEAARLAIHVLGADLMDGTPIYDIKPYLNFTDSHPDARGALHTGRAPLRVEMDDALLALLPVQDRQIVLSLLADDPRPSYQNDPNRRYGMKYGDFDVRFTVDGDVLTVREIEKDPD